MEEFHVKKLVGRQYEVRVSNRVATLENQGDVGDINGAC
jgi:hypothetical protein